MSQTAPQGSTRADSPKRELVAYDFAILRVVPHVHLETFVPIGVVLHARTAEYLALRAITNPVELAVRVPDVEPGLLARYLLACIAIAAGDSAAGPVALAPASERFHWLTAPRSDVLQCSPVHGGLCADPERALEDLFDAYIVRHRAGARAPEAGAREPDKG